MTKCSLLGWEGYCVWQEGCVFRNDDMTCNATENDLVTLNEFMEFRGSCQKARGDE